MHFCAIILIIICKDIKKHSEEERYYKSLQAELKTSKTKLKKLDEDFASKEERFASSMNTFAAKVQSDLINSNKAKYLRQTVTGERVPNWLVVNTDIRKLERICHGKIPSQSEMQQLLNEYNESFAVTLEPSRKSKDRSINRVQDLWEQKGINFPCKGMLPNSFTIRHSQGVIYGRLTSSSTSTAAVTACGPQLLLDEPTTLKEENRHLELGLKESLKMCPSNVLNNHDSSQDYGLSLLFEAAKLVSVD